MIFKRKERIDNENFSGNVRREDLVPWFVISDKPVNVNPAFLLELKNRMNEILYAYEDKKQAIKMAEGKVYLLSNKIKNLENINQETFDKFIKMKGLNEDNIKKVNLIQEELKTIKETQELFKTDLIEEKNKFITEFKEKHESEINQLREENKSLKEQVGKLNKEKEDADYKYINLEEDYKDFVISFLKGDKEKYKKRLLSYLKDLYYERKQEFPVSSDSFAQETSRGIRSSPYFSSSSPSNNSVDSYPINPFSEDYIKGETCVCGHDKSYGAKGCEDCKTLADKFRKRLNIGMEEAWKMVWKDLGINMEGGTEKQLSV